MTELTWTCLPYASRPDEHIGGFTFVKILIANGTEQIRTRCDNCHVILGRSFGRNRFKPEELAEMVTVEDRSNSNPPCVRCGCWGTEEHHWAPRSTFGDEAFLWPTSWLCRDCHIRWHQTTGVAV